MKSIHYLIGVALLLIFAGFSYTTFRDTLTPYVPYEEARLRNHPVQVAGGLEAGSSSYDEVSTSLHFTLVDVEKNDTIRVRYAGVKPANFEDAISIVAIGSYDAQSEELVAEKLLVKCPSKYQGIEEKTYS